MQTLLADALETAATNTRDGDPTLVMTLASAVGDDDLSDTLMEIRTHIDALHNLIDHSGLDPKMVRYANNALGALRVSTAKATTLDHDELAQLDEAAYLAHGIVADQYLDEDRDNVLTTIGDLCDKLAMTVGPIPIEI